MTRQELIEGNYYVTFADNDNGHKGKFIFKAIIGQQNGVKGIDCKYDLFNPSLRIDYETNSNFRNSYQIANQEEIAHLDACIKAGKYIPKEEIVVLDNELKFELW